jgi:hypothetical protein
VSHDEGRADIRWLLLGSVVVGVLITWILGHESAGPRLEPKDPPSFHSSSPPSFRAVEPDNPGRKDPTASSEQRAEPLVTVTGSDTVEGTVVRLSDGSPLRCAVYALISDPKLGDHVSLATISTDEQGRFVFGEDVAAHDPVGLSLGWQSGPNRHGDPPDRKLLSGEHPVPPRGTRSPLRLTLDTGWLVRGRVVSSGRFAVAEARLVAGDLSCQSDGSGQFVLRDLDPAAERVTVTIRLNGQDVGRFKVERPESSLQQEVGDVVVGVWSDRNR